MTGGRLPMSARDWRLRWGSVVLRALHLSAVIWLAAALLGAPVPLRLAAGATVGSGFALLLLDLARKPALLAELSGASLFLKLALVIWMAADEQRRLPLFWLLVFLSAFSAHAPARFRHARWWRRASRRHD